MSFLTLPLDSMPDKGYGNFGKLHKQRQTNKSYPYVEYSDSVEDEEDFLVKQKINSKIGMDMKKSDSHSDLGADKFYFVAGNTKLTDCFNRPDSVLESIVSYARMFNPVPKLTRGPKVGGGASFPNGIGNFRGIGMKAGFASAPPPFDQAFLEKYEEDEEEDDPNDT